MMMMMMMMTIYDDYYYPFQNTESMPSFSNFGHHGTAPVLDQCLPSRLGASLTKRCPRLEVEASNGDNRRGRRLQGMKPFTHCWEW